MKLENVYMLTCVYVHEKERERDVCIIRREKNV